MALTELRIASRRSQLAMVPVNWVKAELEKAHRLEDHRGGHGHPGRQDPGCRSGQDRRQGLFTKELEAQMLVDRADIAVHSLKDYTNLPEGLMLGCITEREDPPTRWW